MDSDHSFYQKLIQFVPIVCQMSAEYFGRCLAELGSVSYILVGITVDVKKA